MSVMCYCTCVIVCVSQALILLHSLDMVDCHPKIKHYNCNGNNIIILKFSNKMVALRRLNGGSSMAGERNCDGSSSSSPATSVTSATDITTSMLLSNS